MTARAVSLVFSIAVMLAADDRLHILRTSQDRAQLERAAIEVATERDAAGLAQLSRLLQSREFLSRLDDLSQPQLKTFRLRRVFTALESNPSVGTGQLCLDAAGSEEFRADPIRMNYLLAALAAVHPMTDRSADLFRQTAREGYLTLNVPLLVKNGEPLALRVFAELAGDRALDVETRGAAVRTAVLPYRTRVAVLETVAKLLQGRVEPAVRIALVEAVFDYQPRLWFGTSSNAPKPPEWSSAEPKAVRLVRSIAERERRRPELPSSIRRAIERTLSQLR